MRPLFSCVLILLSGLALSSCKSGSFEAVQSFREGYAPVKTGGTWKFIGTNGYPLDTGDLVFEDARPFSESLAAVKIKGQWGYISTNGSNVIPPEFDEVKDFKESSAPFRIGSQWGFMDTKGKYVVNPSLQWADQFQSGMARVGVSNAIGFMNRSKKIPVMTFVEAENFQEGLAKVRMDGKYGFIDTDANFIITPQYGNAESFSEGMAVVEFEGKYGYIDKSGNFAINPQFSEARRFKNGYAVVVVDGKFNFIDKTGNYQPTTSSEYPIEFYKTPSGYLGVTRIGEKFGYMTPAGTISINLRYQSARPFNDNGLAAVMVNGLWTYISDKGDQVSKETFDTASELMDFSGGFAVIGNKKKLGIIGTNIQFAVLPEYDEITMLGKSYYAGRKGKTWTILKPSTGEQISSLPAETKK